MFLFLLLFCIFRVFNTYRFPGEEGDRQEVTDGREGRDEEVVVVIRRSRVIGRAAGRSCSSSCQKKSLFYLNSCSPWWSRRTLSGLARRRCWPSWRTSRLTKDKKTIEFPRKKRILFCFSRLQCQNLDLPLLPLEERVPLLTGVARDRLKTMQKSEVKMKKQNFACLFRWASHREILEKGTELGPKKRNIHLKMIF